LVRDRGSPLKGALEKKEKRDQSYPLEKKEKKSLFRQRGGGEVIRGADVGDWISERSILVSIWKKKGKRPRIWNHLWCGIRGK